MKRVHAILERALLQLEGGDSELESMMQDQGDITEPDPEQAGEPEGKPAPLTSKGEEYLLKLVYLALFYTPKDEDLIQLKNTFEASGIHDETAIRAEEPNSIADVKNILVNILGTNNTTNVANQLNQIEGTH